MILSPGTFSVKQYRRNIPHGVKLQVLLNVIWLSLSREIIITSSFPRTVAELQFDHNPALCMRPYDTRAGDFIPPQHDPNYIVAVEKRAHGEKTFGRKADAAKTVTTRGSDVGERSRISDIQVTQAKHEAAMLRKAGQARQATTLIKNTTFKKKHTKRKVKIASRGFSNQYRPMRGSGRAS